MCGNGWRSWTVFVVAGRFAWIYLLFCGVPDLGGDGEVSINIYLMC